MDVGLLAKTTQAVAWTLADMAGGSCDPRGRLSVQQLFRIISGLLPPDVSSTDHEDGAGDANETSPNAVKAGSINGNDTGTLEAFSDNNNNAEKTLTGDVVNASSNSELLDPVKPVSLSSITNALEMLHFLGVVPSIDDITAPENTNNGNRLNRAASKYKRT